MRLVRAISVVTMVHGRCSTSARVTSAMATSSRAALPARSPRPLTATSTCVAPRSTAARELATARPRSLWQCTERTTSAKPGAFSNSSSISAAYSLGSV